MKWLIRSKVLTIAIAGAIWLAATVLMLELFGVHANGRMTLGSA